ncbi:putative L-ascorbate peroxidase 6 [Apium graveolens]|uniref:putative L-ascorbate peroxidase 6 n=1 Tax=Apium graveolens TaxID=4045 RepID=UPI003D78C5C4
MVKKMLFDSSLVTSSYSLLPTFNLNNTIPSTCNTIKISTRIVSKSHDQVVKAKWTRRRRRTVALTSALSLLLPPLQTSIPALAATADVDEFQLIQGEVKKVLTKAKAPGVLRLVFHDAGTYEADTGLGGMNGSIVYELDRPENGGLKKSLKILQKAKSEIDVIQKVSWADMIAVAGAEAVSLCGGPSIPIQLGRIDSMVPDPEDKLPAESLDASTLKQCFEKKGFSTQQLVALSGAHTIGGKGFGEPTVFDNAYFKILLEKPWLTSAGSMIGLPSDRALVQDDECLRWITTYANNEDLFQDDFKNAYIKLVNLGARWRNSI